MKPKVLVTGVAGFIGSNLADALVREGYPVVGIDDLSYGLAEQIPQGVEFHKLDIRDKAIYPLFEGADFVFHLAAKNSLLDCQNDPVATAEINVGGTVNVFEAARRAKAKKVIYAESSAVYEKRARGFYATSKVCAHEFAETFKESFGMTMIGLRYFNVYGPRQDYRRSIPPIMSRFIIDLLLGRTPVLFEGDDRNKRDFIHVDDINRFHMLCIESAAADNRVFDLGTGRNHSMLEVFDLVKKIVGADPEPVTKPRMAGDPPVETLADAVPALALGWQPETEIEAGLRGMVEYIKEEIKEGRIK
jgi:UDP-glucose 4-epimerase